MAWELVQYADGKVEEVWREMPMPDTKELEKEYYAALAEESGPIASRITDSYTHLIAENERLWGVIEVERERAEKAETEVERLKAVLTRLCAASQREPTETDRFMATKMQLVAIEAHNLLKELEAQ